MEYKISDPIHSFIRFDDLERNLINSQPFQRLRYLHQMGMAYLIYPGATHTRFEHSLGVMELATRIYDSLTDPSKISPAVVDLCPRQSQELVYWRQIVRIASLCHDLGHLPFSHTAEKELLPSGGHERMTERIIESDWIGSLLSDLGPNAIDDVCTLAVKERSKQSGAWQQICAGMISDDNFGADRIDYLLRDATYTGVQVGHFDYPQLIDTLRILPFEGELKIGITLAGIQSVESLWMARYLMYARVYHHPKCRVHARHLVRFMVRHYEKVGFPDTLEGYLGECDPCLLSAMMQAKEDVDALALLRKRPCFIEIPTRRVEEEVWRDHASLLEETFGEALFFDDFPGDEEWEPLRHFPVIDRQGSVCLSTEESPFLREIPLSGRKLRIYGDALAIPKMEAWIAERFESVR